MTSQQPSQDFSGLHLPGLRAGGVPRPSEVQLSAVPLTVLVGVTGVGKSTALGVLSTLGAVPGRVLPDRREVTDAVMLWPLAGRPVTDREERFALTAQYRQTHPGGMAQALGSLLADTSFWGLPGQPLIFDGLRGLDEVRYAAEQFPAWRFVALGAPDMVRVQRLLGRSDRFDQIQAAETENLRAALDGLKGIDAVFTPAQRDDLARLSSQGHPPQDILAKTKIVVSERRNYDPQAAEAYLNTLPAARALVLDTVALGPQQVAQAIGDWA